MPTYKQITAWVRECYGFVPKTCWISHIKSDFGLTARFAFNRRSQLARLHPCPESKRSAIIAAFDALR
jgi:hypothetical protein